MKRLLIIFLLMSSVASASDFNVTWILVKEDIVNKEYRITIQNLDIDMRTVDVESFFEDTNFDTSKIQDVEFYEQVVKPVTKEIKHYKTIQVSETVSHIDNKTGMLINITKMVNKSVLDYIENKIVDKQILKKQKTEVLKSNKKTKEILHGKITLPSIKTVGKINNAGTKTFILKFKTPPFGSRGKVGLKINGKEYHPYWNSTWSNRKKITLTGTSSESQTDYQLFLNVTYEPEMNPDFSDVRFCNDTDQLSAWLESKVNESYALIWVKFPHTPANGETEDYWMYYGNSEAEADWNGNTTFEFFDNFKGSSLDANKWVEEATPSISISNSILTITCDAAYEDIKSITYTANGYNSPVAIRTKLKYSGNIPSDFGFGRYTTSPYENCALSLYLSSNHYTLLIGDGTNRELDTTGVSMETDTYYIREITWNSAVKLFKNDSEQISLTNIHPNANLHVKLGNPEYSAGGTRTGYYDWVITRKYTSSEPTYAFGDTGYYVDSIYFNSSNPYYNLIDHKGDIALNHTYSSADDLGWTAAAKDDDTGLVITSIGSSEIDFSIYESVLDWLQLVNLDDSKIYTLQNGSGNLEEHQASGNTVNFTTDLSPDNYEIQITDAVSPTPTPEPSVTTLHDIKMSDADIKSFYYPFMYILFIVIIVGGFMHVFGN